MHTFSTEAFAVLAQLFSTISSSSIRIFAAWLERGFLVQFNFSSFTAAIFLITHTFCFMSRIEFCTAVVLFYVQCCLEIAEVHSTVPVLS